MKGKLIAIEGIDGTGKSTLARDLHKYLSAANIPCALTREPGGTPLGEKIREILLSNESRICAVAETLLIQAMRAQHVHQVIEPMRNQGYHVITDRYQFSTAAYQGAGLGFSPVAVTIRPELMAIPRVDYLIVLDAPVALIKERMKAQGDSLDRIEQRGTEYFERARASFLEAAELYCANSIVIDASLPPGQVFDLAEAFLLKALYKN